MRAPKIKKALKSGRSCEQVKEELRIVQTPLSPTREPMAFPYQWCL